MGVKSAVNSRIEEFVAFYVRHYKKMVFLPIALVVVFGGIIATYYLQHGTPVNEDISLSGGISLTINTNKSVNVQTLTNELASSLKTEVSVAVLHSQFSNNIIGYTITAKNSTTRALNSTVSSFLAPVTSTNSNINFVSPAIAQNSIYDSFILLGAAFILVAFVSLFYFRNPAQSFSNVISIISDVINVIGVMDLLAISFSTASIAGILMLMGYSADRNIILATNILKRKEASVKYRLSHTIKTSLTMDAAALLTFIVLFLGTTNTTIQSIAIILIIGVIFDDFTVWILNGSIQLAAMHYSEEPHQATR